MKLEGKTLEEYLSEIETKMLKAEEDSDEIVIRDLTAQKGDRYLEFGDKERHREFYLKAYEKAVGASKKLDYLMVVLHSYYEANMMDLFFSTFEKCKNLNQDDGDWEKKNKLNIYEGIIEILRRNLRQAAFLFIGSINTFNATEIISFETLVCYSSILGLITLGRKEFKEKIINSSEVLGVYLDNTSMSDFVESIYYGKYSQVFTQLLKLNDTVLTSDRFLKVHRKFIVRQLRIKIFTQYLQSYKTVKLDRMAQDFGVSANFLDEELYSLISNDDLACKVDKVNNVVESSHPDSQLKDLKDIIKNGDKLLEQIHKLAKQAHA